MTGIRITAPFSSPDSALGLLGPIGPALVIMVMIVAMITVPWNNGFFNEAKGIELPLIYSAGAVALAFGGRGHPAHASQAS